MLLSTSWYITLFKFKFTPLTMETTHVLYVPPCVCCMYIEYRVSPLLCAHASSMSMPTLMRISSVCVSLREYFCSNHAMFSSCAYSLCRLRMYVHMSLCVYVTSVCYVFPVSLVCNFICVGPPPCVCMFLPPSVCPPYPFIFFSSCKKSFYVPCLCMLPSCACPLIFGYQPYALLSYWSINGPRDYSISSYFNNLFVCLSYGWPIVCMYIALCMSLHVNVHFCAHFFFVCM